MPPTPTMPSAIPPQDAAEAPPPWDDVPASRSTPGRVPAEKEIEALLQLWVVGWDPLQPDSVSPVPCAPGAVMVRPSGVPMSLEDFYTFLRSGNFSGNFMWQLMDICSIQVHGEVAWATWQWRQRFTYGGKLTDEVALHTGVFALQQDVWHIQHVHRSSGRPYE